MSKVTLGEKHNTATVVVISDSVPAKTLLQHHRKFNRWMPPGGHLDPAENPVEAAVRETLEETGLDVSGVLKIARAFKEDVNMLPLPNYYLEEKIPPHKDQPEHYHLDHIYVVRIPEQPVSRSTRESHDIGWFSLEETKAMDLFEDMHIILGQEMTS